MAATARGEGDGGGEGKGRRSEKKALGISGRKPTCVSGEKRIRLEKSLTGTLCLLFLSSRTQASIA